MVFEGHLAYKMIASHSLEMIGIGMSHYLRVVKASNVNYSHQSDYGHLEAECPSSLIILSSEFRAR